MRPARTPFEWLDQNKIENKAGKVIDTKGCEQTFKRQLGIQWAGVRELELHSQCIAILAGVHGYEGKFGIKAKEGLELRQNISVTYATVKDRNKRRAALEGFLKKYLANEKLVKGIDGRGAKHYYVSTALMRIVQWSREESGVLATAEFLWLKSEDRDLWYALNNVGRRAFHIEGAGPIAHLDAEKIIGSPLLDPHVAMAVKGVEMYVKEHGTDSDTVLKKKDVEEI
jgi:hypothetical protein